MPTTFDEVYTQALGLSDDLKESLAQRLVMYIETHVEPDIERSHLDLAKQRRNEIRSGQVSPLDGDSVMSMVRQIVK